MNSGTITKNMIIAIDARMYGASQFSGIGTYIQKLTDELFMLDKTNEYILFLREPEFSRFNPPNERVTKVLTKVQHYTLTEQTSFILELMKHKFDLIHYPHFNSPILYRKKSICTIHDITPFYYPGHKAKSGFRQWAYRTVFKSTMHKSRKIIAVSNSTKRDIVRHFNINSEKIEVIHHGVDERFKIIENSGIISTVKEKFGITKPYIFFVSVWRSHKNIEGLIQAFNLLKKKHNLDIQLVLGGREDLHYTKVQDEINRSPFKHDIIATGFIEDDELPAIYNGASAFVVPSFIEGFGLIGIEAQNCGCPVVSTNTSSMPETLGESALFFDPKNIEEMAKQINLVLTDKKTNQELIDKAKYNVERFHWRKCAEQTLQIYKNLK
ncbi:glycosyltransferase family 4 protein [Candidatus Falkowbacteria bacterium]|jgi:glycosyltransferase involved in cell wall biosynthesis|nr:glycosyltransferase family 4 protein [Candidatus Falkowbacteria bacterium]MBT5503703.1 glycosyltransferase family 4 protein [Candidatus Falkowbacteria bacterium]MBT7348755.1 glycosyltransferase family 4 protein [Candidatus Falkowbacteria bacterium]